MKAIIKVKEWVQENIKGVDILKVEPILDEFIEREYNKKFDTIVIENILENVSNPIMFIKKSKELLKTDGRLIVVAHFGINSTVNQRRTYYFLELFDLINRSICTSKVHFGANWIAFVADMSLSEPSLKIDEKIVEKLENAIFAIETSDKSEFEVESSKELQEKLENITATLNQKENELKNSEAKFAEQTKQKNLLLKEKEILQKEFNEYNTMLYQARKLNAAYERFPSIKLYNWMRKYKNQNKYKDSIKQTLQDSIKTTNVVHVDTKSTIPSKTQTIKYDKLFSDFIEVNISLNDQENLFKLRKDCHSLKDLKVACIMDEFTFSCFAPECNILQLTPENWHEEMNQFVPDMLFVESAWQGKEGKWYGMIAKTMPVFRDLINYCNCYNIPVVFWNKEDPVHNEGFMTAASLCDFVFTTEIDCIAQYKRCLGHNRVYLSHFAAQPKLHNPIETFERKDEFCFAGSYYSNYPDRTRQFDNLAHYAMRTKGLDIYDRNFNDNSSVHQFPEFYKPFIMGKLETNEIEKAYKGYMYNINANSVGLSQTMFARRVFELLASNSISIGNFSRGLRNIFGDLTISTNNITEISRLMEKYCSKKEDVHRYRLHGFRKVTKEDLYEDRLDYMIEKVFGVSLKKQLPTVFVIGKAQNKNEFDKIINMAENQNYSDIKIRIKPEFDIEYNADCMIKPDMTLENFIKQEIDPCYIAYFDAKDFYGKDYLNDMILMLRYGEYDVVGKTSYYDGEGILHENHSVYNNVSDISLKRAIISSKAFYDLSDKNGNIINSNSQYNMISIHEFDYAENADSLPENANSDVGVNFTGIPYKKLLNESEKIVAKKSNMYIISPSSFFKEGKYANDIELKEKENCLEIESSLNKDTHNYIYTKEIIKCDIDKSDFSFILVEGSTSLDVMIAFMCFDKNMKSTGTVFASVGYSKKEKLPEGTEYIKLALRIKGSGNSYIGKIRICKSEIGHEEKFITKSKTLVLTNIYPSYEDLYRNAFVHQRVLEYKKKGKNVDVMCVGPRYKFSYREFEGIDIVSGDTNDLKQILANGSVDTVCVHFLDRHMWNALKNFKDKIRIIVWCHGSEIQPWWRREYNYTTEEELKNAKIASEDRMTFWKEVFDNIEKYNIHFVFVSQYFKDEICQDYNIQLSDEVYSIIHNYINTDLFDFCEKDVDKRKNILSIRPFASNKYANDLTVKCIKELSTKPYFNELRFHIIGRGELFDTVAKELEDFDNVIIEEKFLSQYEISKLHKDNGLFMVPTRMDSQGVSRDEAMSSGLVPITNAVTAIPEFVDNNCGILAPGEDYIEMAKGIEKLYYSPALFIEMSKNAAERVRKQSSKKLTIEKELAIINQNN